MAQRDRAHWPSGARHGAEQDTRGAALLGDARVLSRRTRSSISSRTTTITSPKPTCLRGTSTSRRIRASTSTSSRCGSPRPRRCSSGRTAIIVATVSCIYGIGDPAEYHGMILHLREREKISQRDAIQRLTEMQYTAQRVRVPARHVPRARRRARHFSGGELRERGARLAVRRRGRELTSSIR